MQADNREELLNKIEKLAQDYEMKYHGCSRCTLKALQENLNLGNDLTFMAATPLGGGIAGTGRTCGALLGGLLAVGLATASPKIEEEALQLHSTVQGFRFLRRFEKEMGHTVCREIMRARMGRSYSFTDPGEYEEFKKAGGYNVASKVVGKASRLAAEFILDLPAE